jgi:CubicO group peptidase (beta-lactamase class C family)
MNQKGIFNGSVLVSQAGKVIYKKALGLSNKKNNYLLNDTSMFQLASVSKVITATAILMLHERNLVDLEEYFSYYFPDFPYERVKIKDLLSHRSGLPNYMYTLNDEICRPDHKMSNEEMYNCMVVKKAAP